MISITTIGQKSTFPLTSFGEITTAQLVAKMYAQFPYNINSELFDDNSSGSGTAVANNSFLELSSGAATTSVGCLTSIPVIEYHPGTGALIRFTAIFDTAVAGNTQLVGAGSDDNGFFIGYNGTNFAINRRKDGTDNFTNQSSFSVDKLDGTGASGMTLDTSKGNVFQIQYQWLGFGEIRFSVEDEVTGKIIPFHKIQYVNQNTVLSITNPTVPFQAESRNTTNNTDVVLKVPSAGVYVEGQESNAMHLVHASQNTKTGVTTETNVITMRNNATYASKTNFLRVQPKIVSAAVDGSKPAVITCYKNTTLGGTPSYTDFNSNTSPVAIDTAGTTITGGILLLSFALGKSEGTLIDLENLPIILAPGDTFTVACSSVNSTDASVGITWEERFS